MAKQNWKLLKITLVNEEVFLEIKYLASSGYKNELLNRLEKWMWFNHIDLRIFVEKIKLVACIHKSPTNQARRELRNIVEQLIISVQ